MSKRIYADYAAATPTDPAVIQVMTQAYNEYGNPSSAHSFGRSANNLLEQSRASIAEFFKAREEEIYLTSSGTESNNLAIIGTAKANRGKGMHIITSAIEHPSVLNACRILEKEGFKVTYLPVTAAGLIEVEQFERELTKQTILATFHLANSEIGVIQNISELAAVARRHGVALHADACQAGALLDLNVNDLGVDLLSCNGSKLYGPRGTAVLYVRQNHPIFPISYGGGQERSLRSGTPNVPGVVGLAEAMRIARQRRQQDFSQIEELRDSLERLLPQNVTVNVVDSPRLPNHLSVRIAGTADANLVEAMDQRHVAVSSGSACSATSMVESHVLRAIGLSSAQINQTLRISLGRNTTSDEVSIIAAAIVDLQSQ